MDFSGRSARAGLGCVSWWLVVYLSNSQDPYIPLRQNMKIWKNTWNIGNIQEYTIIYMKIHNIHWTIWKYMKTHNHTWKSVEYTKNYMKIHEQIWKDISSICYFKSVDLLTWISLVVLLVVCWPRVGSLLACGVSLQVKEPIHPKNTYEKKRKW